jgi:hypothetical protein
MKFPSRSLSIIITSSSLLVLLRSMAKTQGSSPSTLIKLHRLHMTSSLCSYRLRLQWTGLTPCRLFRLGHGSNWISAMKLDLMRLHLTVFSSFN